ncbi:MDIS1-interacting receptor like kinase 2-like [Magnolia sinica]|uniref:MDIS1-interacting receptor like kinase 2-like n=1 Tax=Magnolia sinica TaxID=86752 RepID=UPI002659A9CB|nr:MDIS1-interacting receptor like kinase 2-like [Magnolia sinica]
MAIHKSLPFAFLLILLAFLSFQVISFATAAPSSTLSEVEALMKWKASLLAAQALHSWSLPSTNSTTNIISPCNWTGISCNILGSVTRISLPSVGLQGNLDNLSFPSFPNLHLDLSDNTLTGTIPAHISTLYKLKTLNLFANEIGGSIPLEIGNLVNLNELDLSINHLNGSIPSTIGNLTKLSILYLDQNRISGSIPSQIGNLQALVELTLFQNNLTGPIPPALGNLSNLTILYLYKTQVSGSIPPEIGNLVNLKELDLSTNLLTGSIPSTLGNLSMLTLLYLFENQFSGSIPVEIGNLVNLKELEMSTNLLTGSIPSTLGNLTKLIVLYLDDCQLSGSLPQEMTNMTNLSKLQLDGNNFSGHLPHFCHGGSFKAFTAFNNHFTGEIPRTFRNCTSLRRVRLNGNQLAANVSEAFGVYPHLIFMDVSDNMLFGELSPHWGECQNLTKLQLSGNNITGRIPPQFGQLGQLGVLDLSSNHLVGEIPKEFGRLASLINLTLNDNQLSGQLPQEIGNLSNLEILDLSMNHLSGPTPPQLGDCSKLHFLKLSENVLNGSIPFQIGNLVYLQGLLDLSHNSLNGKIPPQLAKLASLEILNLSHNILSSFIPPSFDGMVSLQSIDFSYNVLEGPLPSSKAFQKAPTDAFIKNKGLCGEVQGLPPCNASLISHGDARKWHKDVILIILLFSVLFLLFTIIGIISSINYQKRRRIEKGVLERSKGNTFSTWNYNGISTFEDIVAVTEGFDDKYCIEIGGYGKVYKANLPAGQVVAVKKLHPLEAGNQSDQKSFKNEIQALMEIRHCNIVKLYSFCSHARVSFLVYEYMERGSLASILSNDEGAAQLDWTLRVKVIKCLAHALSYIDHDCTLPIVHRDLSSHNVLLNLELEASVSDFGTARLLIPDSSDWTTLAGTFGYIAPGYLLLALIYYEVCVYVRILLLNVAIQGNWNMRNLYLKMLSFPTMIL